jgi:surfeit locus 1 family protein
VRERWPWRRVAAPRSDPTALPESDRAPVAAQADRRRPGLALFCLLIAALTASLCSWQVSRAYEKAELEAVAAERDRAGPAEGLPDEPTGEDLWRRHRVEGVPDRQHALLLDNRTLDGRPGYELYRLLWLDTGRGLLVADGFLPAGGDRGTLPDVPPFRSVPGSEGAGTLVVEGRLFPPDRNVVWDGAIAEGGWPARIQALRPDALEPVLSERLGRPVALYPLPLLNEYRARPTSRRVVRMGSATHWGYAAQWAGLTGVALVGAYLALRRSASGP